MTDWKTDLKSLAEKLRQDQKNKKKERSKFEDMENFRGRKGFNDTGIPLTERAVKQQRNNKLAYGKTRYAGSRLNFINDARAAAARLKRLENPEHKDRIDAVLEIADERIAEKARQQSYQIKLDSMRSRDTDTNINSGNRKHVYYDGASVDDGSVEIDPYAVAAASSSVINQDPQFRNKVEEEIYRLKNKN